MESAKRGSAEWLTLIYEMAADHQIHGCHLAFRRGEEICNALLDLISRMSQCGMRIDGTDPPEFVIKSAGPLANDVPTVTMHYRVEADGCSVTIIKVRYHDA